MLEVEAAVSGVGVLRKVLTSFAGAAAKDVVIEAGIESAAKGGTDNYRRRDEAC